MRSLQPLDDATVEAILRGESVRPELVALTDTVETIRGVANTPVEPSAELADRMASGKFPDAELLPYAHRRGNGARLRSSLAALSWRVKAATSCALIVIGGTSVAASGMLPDPIPDRVRSVIEAMTPISFTSQMEVGEDIARQVGAGTIESGSKKPEPVDSRGNAPEDPDERGNAPEDPGERGNAPEDPGE
ncbi:hypothetical protein, partial [Phytoactinopolyspora halophila]